MPTHLLLIDCPDRAGLVHEVTGVLYRHGFNIVHNHEFVEATTAHFFMRTAFSGASDPAPLLEEWRAQLPPDAQIRLVPTGKRPVVILATKEPHCLGDLLLRAAYDDLPIDVRAVISNHAVLEPLVERFGLPFHHLSHQGLERQAHEAALLDVLDEYAPEYLILAKYMRILTPAFVARYPQRIINIHHSFLPAFVGARPYHQAYERGVKIIGATAHFVTDDLDTGPIIAQGVLPVDHSYTAADMAHAGRDIEQIVLAKAVRLVVEERVFVHHNRTVVFE